MTITDIDALSVKAGFAETDATKLQVGQPAAVSFSALPSVQAAGFVSSVDASSTLVSNVVTYFATVKLTKVPASVKPGMTASVTITVNRREGVLNLPNAAVRGTGSTGTVTLVDGKTQTTKVVGVGVRGDTTTEITSGLQRGRHRRAVVGHRERCREPARLRESLRRPRWARWSRRRRRRGRRASGWRRLIVRAPVARARRRREALRRG